MAAEEGRYLVECLVLRLGDNLVSEDPEESQ